MQNFKGNILFDLGRNHTSLFQELKSGIINYEKKRKAFYGKFHNPQFKFIQTYVRWFVCLY